MESSRQQIRDWNDQRDNLGSSSRNRGAEETISRDWGRQDRDRDERGRRRFDADREQVQGGNGGSPTEPIRGAYQPEDFWRDHLNGHTARSNPNRYSEINRRMALKDWDDEVGSEKQESDFEANDDDYPFDRNSKS